MNNNRKEMPKTYVEIIRAWKALGGPKCYCPYDVETNTLYFGLSLIGFIPKKGKVIGVFDEAKDKLTLQEGGVV